MVLSDYTKGFEAGKVSQEAEKYWYSRLFKTLNPIELLEKQLKDHEHALEKSITFYKQNKITASVHLTHKENLTKLITAYKEAINTLKINRI